MILYWELKWVNMIGQNCIMWLLLIWSHPIEMIDAVNQWCLHNLLGIKCYHHVRNDDVRWKTEQPHLSATVQAQHLSLFSHIARMPDESDAKQILTASPLENWRRPPGRPRTTWMKTTQQDLKSMNLSWTKQLTWLRIAHSGYWCLHLALRTHSGACQKWMNEWRLTMSNKFALFSLLVSSQPTRYIQTAILFSLC